MALNENEIASTYTRRRRLLNDHENWPIGHISKKAPTDKGRSIYRNLHKNLRHEFEEGDRDDRSQNDVIWLANFLDSIRDRKAAKKNRL